MVGLLATVIGATLITAVVRGRTGFLEVMVLAAGSALAFAGVDLWYGLSRRISAVYLVDAVVELGFVVLLALTGRPGRSLK
jgi:hypothetical protein